MKRSVFLLVAIVSILFTSCEEIIDINLNDADPKVVIVADIDGTNENVIYVSRTVPVDDPRKSEVIKDAEVFMMRSGEYGESTTIEFEFSEQHQGYVNSSLVPRQNVTYYLAVRVGETVYRSIESMPHYVDVDSLGTVRENIFGDDYFFGTFKFQDPIGVSNYYKYNVSVDGKPFKFYAAYSDKFNDGLYVSHQIGSVDEDITESSQIVVRRQVISAGVYKYWSDVQSINPGTAAPGNPKSNIDGGALGYFSVSNSKEYTFRFSNFADPDDESNEDL